MPKIIFNIEDTKFLNINSKKIYYTKHGWIIVHLAFAKAKQIKMIISKYGVILHLQLSYKNAHMERL